VRKGRGSGNRCLFGPLFQPIPLRRPRPARSVCKFRDQDMDENISLAMLKATFMFSLSSLELAAMILVVRNLGALSRASTVRHDSGDGLAAQSLIHLLQKACHICKALLSATLTVSFNNAQLGNHAILRC
jgi:hypothetical protein